jgi:hypothetical protein
VVLGRVGVAQQLGEVARVARIDADADRSADVERASFDIERPRQHPEDALCDACSFLRISDALDQDKIVAAQASQCFARQEALQARADLPQQRIPCLVAEATRSPA